MFGHPNSPSPKPRVSRNRERDVQNQPSVLSFYNVIESSPTAKKRTILREETYGINVGHLRRLARLGGVVPLGEMAFDHMVCEICKQGTDEDNIIICDKCNKGYHLYCVKPILPSVPSGDWFCDHCRESDNKKYVKNRKRLEESQSLIIDFFKLTHPIPTITKYNFRSSTVSSNVTPIIKSLPSPPKGRGYLKCYIPSTDPVKIKKQHVALASAMFQQGIQFSYELVYKSGCSPKLNLAEFDEQRHLLEVDMVCPPKHRKCARAIVKCMKQPFNFPEKGLWFLFLFIKTRYKGKRKCRNPS